MKIYIAGKINGLNDYKDKFKKAEEYLKEQGHICMLPSVLPEGFPYEIYMPICLNMINACEAIFMLDNWRDSKGARLELQYARLMNKQVLYQNESILE